MATEPPLARYPGLIHHTIPFAMTQFGGPLYCCSGGIEMIVNRSGCDSHLHVLCFLKWPDPLCFSVWHYLTLSQVRLWRRTCGRLGRAALQMACECGRICTMAERKPWKASRSSHGNPDHHQGDKLKKRKELFIQQFEKEAQERMNEMEARLDKLLATLDRAFKIEMMKLPQSLHTTLIKDLMIARETSVGEVTMAIASASPEIRKPLSRKPSKKGKASNTAAQEPLIGLIKTDEPSKRQTKTKMHLSNSTGSLRCASSIGAKRGHSRIVKLSDQGHLLGLKMRETNRSLSDDLSGTAIATITTSHGETLLLSEETKDDVRLELLDDMALCQMQKIKELMEYLCNKVRLNNTQ